MQITLFCIGSNFTCIGPRRISSYLKSKAIETKMVFVPAASDFRFSLKKSHREGLMDVLRNDIAVGMSFTSNYLRVAEALTAFIKKGLSLPVIWGGVHATVAPEESLGICDAVCLGEGEEPLFEFLDGGVSSQENNKIDNLWFKLDNQILRNKQRPLRSDLDGLPYQDYEIENHFILEGHCLRQLQDKDLRRNFGFSLTRMMTFGCPFKCTYCANSRYQSLDRESLHMRRYSVDYLIKETRYILNRLPFINYLLFDDDAFLSLPQNVIEEFCRKYKREIRLPFGIGGIKAEIVEEKKLFPLIDAGLITVRMGIQSASRRTNSEVFHRRFSYEENLNVAKIFKSFGSKLRPPFYDIILDNPWEDTKDELETLGFLRALPRPYFLNVFSLTFFPGTGLYERALKEGLISIYDPSKHYHNFKKTYLNILMLFSSIFKIPDRFLGSKRIEDRYREYMLFYYIYKGFDLFFRLASYYINHKFLMAMIRRFNKKEHTLWDRCQIRKIKK